MRALVAVACFILFAGFMPKNNGSFIVEPSGGALADLVAPMVSGQWLMIPDSYIGDVLFTSSEHTALLDANPGTSSFFGIGAKAVINAWNGAAFDPAGNRWFFMGGGHGDYGGNEVYQYDFDTLQWTRLIEPSPLGTQITEGVSIGEYIPNVGPISPHAYDGHIWNPATQTFWATSVAAGYNSPLFGGSGNSVDPPYKAVWEFDPDIPAWSESHPHDHTSNFNRATAVILPDNRLLVVSLDFGGRKGYFFNPDGTYTKANSGNFLSGSWDGEQNSVLIPATASPSIAGRLFLLDTVGITEYSISGDTITQVGAPLTYPTLTPDIGAWLRQSGWVFNPNDELVYVWDGDREVHTWNPATNTWASLANASSPTAPTSDISRIFDKWIWLDTVGVFAGISGSQVLTEATYSIWIYKP